MRRSIVVLATLALALNALATPASADPVAPPLEDPTIDHTRVPAQTSTSGGPSKTRAKPPLEPKTHDQFKVDGAISGASIQGDGPHGDWLSLDYKTSNSADTLYWSNNKALSGSAASLGTYDLRTAKDPNTGQVYYPNPTCPVNSTNFDQFSHYEQAVGVTANYTDGLGTPWTFVNQYWHMQTISTGTKANGASIGTQYPTHPIGGCKFYYAPGTGWHGNLASTGPHIHHYAQNASTYESSPIKLVWNMLSH